MSLSLEDRSDDSLFEEIGSYVAALDEVDGAEDVDVMHDLVLGMSARDSLLSMGKQLYTRVVREMYNLFCGNAKADRDDRNQLLNASGLSSTLARTLVTGMIVKYLGIAAALSTVIAALFCRRILLPAGDEVCRFWGNNLTL